MRTFMQRRRVPLSPARRPIAFRPGLGRAPERSRVRAILHPEIAKSHGAEGEQERKKNTASTSGAKIDISFDPAKSTKATKCDEIVHVQFALQYADGKVIKPGDYYSGYKYQDAVVTSKGYHVDHVKGETSPDYQQGTGVGKKNGSTTNATMSDTPNTGGGDKGFFSTANPSGWKNVTYEFATYGWCKKGTDCPKWYEGLAWKYVKTWEDKRDGKGGTSTVTDSDAAGPTADHLEAFKLFNKTKGYTPCS